MNPPSFPAKSGLRHLASLLSAVVFVLLALGSGSEGGKKVDGASSKPSSKGENDGSEAGRSRTQESPEQQFMDFQKRRMGPNFKILQVVMNEKSRNGSKVLYEGFYRYKMDVRGLVGAKEELSFFTAIFVNGRMTEWMPSRR